MPGPDSLTSALPGLTLQTPSGTLWGSRTHLSTERPVALAVESQGEVQGARTPSITSMRLSAQHLFLLNDTPKASGFCPLEARLGPFSPLVCKIKGAGVAGAELRSLNLSCGESDPPQACRRGWQNRVTRVQVACTWKSPGPRPLSLSIWVSSSVWRALALWDLHLPERPSSPGR